VLGHDGHERLREGTFREQTSEQIRDLVREDEYLERNRGNERGVDHVAHQPGDARQERGGARYGRAAKETAAQDVPREGWVVFIRARYYECATALTSADAQSDGSGQRAPRSWRDAR